MSTPDAEHRREDRARVVDDLLGSASLVAGEHASVGERETVTGATDEQYNLISVLFHALKGAEACAKYVEDAERAGDDELADFFEEVQEEEELRATRAKELLAERLGVSDDEETTEES